MSYLKKDGTHVKSIPYIEDYILDDDSTVEDSFYVDVHDTLGRLVYRSDRLTSYPNRNQLKWILLKAQEKESESALFAEVHRNWELVY